MCFSHNRNKANETYRDMVVFISRKNALILSNLRTLGLRASHAELRLYLLHLEIIENE